MEFQIIAALVSLVSVVIAVGVMWGRLRRTVNGHDELLEKLSGHENTDRRCLRYPQPGKHQDDFVPPH